MDEVSVRTEYRERRVKLIRSTIALLIEMLLIPKQKLEKIPLSFFKNLKNSVAGELFLEKDSERDMHDSSIYPNDLDATAKTYQRNHFTQKVKKTEDSNQFPIRED